MLSVKAKLFARRAHNPTVKNSKSNSIIKKQQHHKSDAFVFWLRRLDPDQRPSGYEDLYRLLTCRPEPYQVVDVFPKSRLERRLIACNYIKH